MLLIEEQKSRLNILNDKMPLLTQALEQDKLQMRLDELEIKTSQPDFWDDAAASGAVLKEMGGIKDTLQSLSDLAAKIEDAYTLIELAVEMDDESMIEEIVCEIDAIEQLGYPGEFGEVIASQLGGAHSMRRMTSYLRGAHPHSPEEIADEMLAIIQMRESWVHQKISEHANASITAFYNRPRDD